MPISGPEEVSTLSLLRSAILLERNIFTLFLPANEVCYCCLSLLYNVILKALYLYIVIELLLISVKQWSNVEVFINWYSGFQAAVDTPEILLLLLLLLLLLPYGRINSK